MPDLWEREVKVVKNNRLLLINLMLLLVTSTSVADERLQQSRSLSDALGQRLRSQLVTAMQANGPVAAIETCYVVAPAIANEIGMPATVSVGRTSLRLRSLDNAPDDWQRRQLMSLQKRLDDGEAWETLEVFELLENGAARYMRAIPMQAPCLTCHGGELAPDVAARLHDLYPNDQATGYSLGALRGAFFVDWPIDE